MRQVKRVSRIARSVGKGRRSSVQALRFCLRSSSHLWPSALIQFDASSSEEPSKISSEWVPSSEAHTDHMDP